MSAATRPSRPADLEREFRENVANGCVGSILVSENDRVRVWHLSIPAGKRCPVHRHVLTYFWTAHASGRARNYFEDGRIVDVDHYKGETKHLTFGRGEYMMHAVENIGETELLFTTVEFLDGSNPPLAVPESMRLVPPSATAASISRTYSPTN